MTRVHEALHKAAAAGDDVAMPPILTRPQAIPNEPELWPAERDPARASRERDARHPSDSNGTVGERPEPSALTRAGRDAGGKLVTREMDPRSVEQYRRLGARLYLAQAAHDTRLVMVTSALVGEGKTLTAANLALTLSQSYKQRVLLMDADFRRPWIHQLFGLPNVTGLNDGIRADSPRKVPVIRLSDHLSVLTAGRPDPDPMAVLASARMGRALRDAAAAFDWVIIDTPPVGLLSDAHLLAAMVDTIVLVVRAGQTPVQAINAAMTSVGRDRIAGIVLNCATPKRFAKYYDYYARDGASVPVAAAADGR